VDDDSLSLAALVFASGLAAGAATAARVAAEAVVPVVTSTASAASSVGAGVQVVTIAVGLVETAAVVTATATAAMAASTSAGAAAATRGLAAATAVTLLAMALLLVDHNASVDALLVFTVRVLAGFTAAAFFLTAVVAFRNATGFAAAATASMSSPVLSSSAGLGLELSESLRVLLLSERHLLVGGSALNANCFDRKEQNGNDSEEFHLFTIQYLDRP
jgi:hypothetical protein